MSATTTSATRTTTSVLTPQAAVLLELEESTTALVSGFALTSWFRACMLRLGVDRSNHNMWMLQQHDEYVLLM